MKLEDIINNNKVINLNELKADAQLLKQIQTKLSLLGLYPGGRLIDGLYGMRTKDALVEFCAATNLNNMNIGKFNPDFAEKLLNFEVLPFALEGARDRKRVLSHFLAEGKATANKLAFLDRGINNSLYKEEAKHYPDRLQEKPDGQNVVSYGESIVLSGTNQTVKFSSYPNIGAHPDLEIDEQSLNFLDENITHACVCIGSFVDREIKAHWLGKNAKSETQFWSATKIIPILNVVSQANQNFPDSEADNWVINNHSFVDLVTDVVSMQNRIGSSNALAAMFKKFQTPEGLENWTKEITGNQQLTFRGRYGEAPFINKPKLVDKTNSLPLLTAASANHDGSNFVSAYDLTRFISMLGWHHHIPQEARLPDAQWHSLKTVIKAMGTDKARYADVAIKRLGLESVIKSPVIISKLGNGVSQSRQKTEIVYVALIQFIDELPKAEDKPAKLRTISMTLRGAKEPNETVALDALMAAEVTEILRRLVTEELA